MVEYLLYGGKGGVGKTTCAAATGLALGRAGRETLVVSTDPAHSLGDAFETSVGDEPTEIEDCLFAREVDPAAGVDRYRRLFEAVADELDDVGVDLDVGDVRDLFTTGAVPGSDELAALEAFGGSLDAAWDVVVFDTAPTGHTLRLLDAPEAVGTGVRTALSLRSQVRRKAEAARTALFGPYATLGRTADDEAAEFEAVIAEVEQVATALRDPERTTFRVVCTPERMVLAETERLVERLREFGMPVGAVVVNRVLADPDPNCARCQRIYERQREVLDDVENAFSERPIVTLPDVTGVAEGSAVLERLAADLREAGFA